MKKIIAIGFLLASMNAFSQSYLVLNNGVTLTIDKGGFIYDFHHFRLPYKVEINGGQFLVEDEKLSTLDSNGLLFEKDFEVKKLKGKGLNYFIKGDNHLVTIDSQGFFYEYDEDQRIFKKVSTFGGNFFIVNLKRRVFELYTINNSGNYFKMEVEGLNPGEITQAGGSFFQTKDGLTYTVSNDGFVFEKSDITTGAIVKAGGNFFIDLTNKLYTVSDDGLLILPPLPMNLKVSDITQIGSNYMLDSEGRIFTVDSLGGVHERFVNHDLTNVKILSR